MSSFINAEKENEMETSTNAAAAKPNPFYSQPMNDTQKALADEFRTMFDKLALRTNNDLPAGRYRAIVITKLEEAAMFATKAITHEWKE